MSVQGDQRRKIGLAVRCAALLVLLPLNGFAETLPPVIATDTSIPIVNATDIKTQPLALLAKYPEAGPAMARFVAQQLTQQPGAVDAMLSIIKDSSPQQASAIGAGMVRAARNLSAKHPASARAISEKVMRTDNQWLRTTYTSLGPRYSGNAVFAAPADLPPREAVATGEMGLGLGGAWRVGPVQNNNYPGANGDQNANEIIKTCLYDSTGYVDPHCRGMIVAIIKSDAGHNGAVSTSPTI